MRKYFVVMTALIIFNFVAAEDKVKTDINSGHFTSVMTAEGQGQKQQMSSEFWFKGEKVRIEMSIQAKKNILIFDGKNGYEINESAKSIMKSDPPANDVFSKPRFYLKSPILFQKEPEWKEEGKEEIEGIECVVKKTTVRSQRGSFELTQWVDKRDIAIKTEMEAEGGAVKQTIINKDIELNNEIDGKLFELPADMKIITAPKEGVPAIEFALKDLENKEIKLSDFKDKKVLLVNFFATWCGPCKQETPEFVEVYKDYKNKDVEFISVDVMERGDAKKLVTKFKEEFDIDWPILLGTNTDIPGLYRIQAVPTNMIVDKNGIISYYRAGGISANILEKELDKALAKSKEENKKE